MIRLIKKLYYRFVLKVPKYEQYDYDTEPDGGFIDDWRTR